MIDIHRIRCRRGKFLPIEPGLSPHNHRPSLRVCGGFAGEIPGIKFFEGGIYVVDVEQDPGRELAFRVCFDKAEHLATERLGSSVSTCEEESTEREALSARRSHTERHVRGASVGYRTHLSDFGIS